MARPDLEVLLPVHNEGECIRQVLDELHAEFSKQVNVRFIVSEDGSKDNTRDVLSEAAKSIPMQLIMGPERKGYSKAVMDGMALLEAPYILCLDSDG